MTVAKRPTKKQLRVRAARKLDKKSRTGSYAYKLSVLRKVVAGFDAKKFDTLRVRQPRTDATRKQRKRDLDKVAAAFRRIKPYVTRPHKFVAPKSKKHFESMRHFARVPRFKKMRAIPYSTAAKKLSIRFNKAGRPTVKEDGLTAQYFLFPRKPRARTVKQKDGSKRFIDIQEDATAMLKAMLPTMPQGFYALMTDQQFLISDVGDRESLLEDLARFYDKYDEPDEEGRGGENFVTRIIGFKYLTDSIDQYDQWLREMKSKREAERGARKRQRIAKALKEIIAMDKQLKSGKPLSRGQQTRRGRLTGRR